VLDRLEEDDLKGNTLIAFASDHGLAVGQHGLLGKQNLYEHSVRAPLLFAGPGVPVNQSSRALCYLGDIFPTLLDIAEIEHKEASSFQSLRACFKGESSREQIVTAYKNSQRAIISSRWKLVAYPKINKLQLFDLKEDPHEINDLSEDAEHSMALGQYTRELEMRMEGLVKAIPLRSSAPLPEAFDFSPYRAKK
jgi:arylsulfatase A-like enzyme